ncbi:MAG: MotA/TolQ/ExbB proton channel family protein [Candidatus Omnitrophica bacterium]|nr:MotA/TolQ/ExbB proton channel family protein [Candidatus Omnitrophota bacterium]
MNSLIIKGGWVMAPILLGSVIALTLVLERIWFFLTTAFDPEKFSAEIFSLVEGKRAEDALEKCRQARHPLAAVFAAGLAHAGEDVSEIDRVMEREANRQIQKVEKNLNLLVLVIGIEPLLGFLGTILGLIQAFMSWEKFSASVTVSNLAGGIYQAMITTAAGLIVAIPYYVIYNLFLAKVNAVARDLNHYGDELVSLLYGKGRPKG